MNTAFLAAFTSLSVVEVVPVAETLYSMKVNYRH